MKDSILKQIRSTIPVDPGALQWFKSQCVSDRSLLAFYQNGNGGYLLNDALHIYSFGATREFDNIKIRNLHFRGLYGDRFSSACCIGEDTFGNQFSYLDGRIGRIDIETGEFLELGDSFSDWSDEIDREPNFLSGLNLRDAWSAQYGEIPSEALLSPRMPFVLGGDFSAKNLHAMFWRDVLEFANSIFEQIRNLPDGTRFEIRREPPN